MVQEFKKLVLEDGLLKICIIKMVSCIHIGNFLIIVAEYMTLSDDILMPRKRAF